MVIFSWLGNIEFELRFQTLFGAQILYQAKAYWHQNCQIRYHLVFIYSHPHLRNYFNWILRYIKPVFCFQIQTWITSMSFTHLGNFLLRTFHVNWFNQMIDLRILNFWNTEILFLIFQAQFQWLVLYYWLYRELRQIYWFLNLKLKRISLQHQWVYLGWSFDCLIMHFKFSFGLNNKLK